MSHTRIGTGFDAHPFGGPGPVRIGGVDVPHSDGLKGHSDGDALLHALADALLGAAGLSSLGEHFPDTEEAWKGVDSAVLLERARDLVRAAGFSVVNADAVIIAEEPRIAPHRERMRARLAEILDLSLERINVRGTSSNGLGFTGRGEGVAAIAVVLLEKTES